MIEQQQKSVIKTSGKAIMEDPKYTGPEYAYAIGVELVDDVSVPERPTIKYKSKKFDCKILNSGWWHAGFYELAEWPGYTIQLPETKQRMEYNGSPIIIARSLSFQSGKAGSYWSVFISLDGTIVHCLGYLKTRDRAATAAWLIHMGVFNPTKPSVDSISELVREVYEQ